MIASVNREDIAVKRIELDQMCQTILRVNHQEVKSIDLVQMLKRVVPEFVSQNSIYEVLDKQPSLPN